MLTEEDVRRIVHEELARVNLVPTPEDGAQVERLAGQWADYSKPVSPIVVGSPPVE